MKDKLSWIVPIVIAVGLVVAGIVTQGGDEEDAGPDPVTDGSANATDDAGPDESDEVPDVPTGPKRHEPNFMHEEAAADGSWGEATGTRWRRLEAVSVEGSGFTELRGQTIGLLETKPDAAALPRAFDGRREVGGVSLADWSGDGRGDLIYADPVRGLQVWRNDGEGPAIRFESIPVTGEAAGMLAVAVLDIDADGDLDAIAAQADGGWRAFTNEAGTRFVAGPRQDPTGVFRTITGGDVTGDGRVDLLLGGYTVEGGAPADRLLTRTDAGWRSSPLADRIRLAPDSGVTTGWLLVAGDEELGLELLRSSTAASVQRYTADGAGGWRYAPWRTAHPITAANDLLVRDIDSTVSADILTLGHRTNSSAPVAGLYAQQTAEYLPELARAAGLTAPDADATGYRSLVALDLELNSHTDLLAATADWDAAADAAPANRLWRNGTRSNPAFTAEAESLPMLTGHTLLWQAGDLDRDGDEDLVELDREAGLVVWRNEAPRPRSLVRLIGPDGNRQAIGARLIVTSVPGRNNQPLLSPQAAHVTLGGANGSDATRAITFAATMGPPTRLVVEWPDGKTAIVLMQANVEYEVTYLERDTPRPESRGGAASTGRPPVFVADNGTVLPESDDINGSAGAVWGDLNGDGEEDLLLPAAKGSRHAIWYANPRSPDAYTFAPQEARPVASATVAQALVTVRPTGDGDRVEPAILLGYADHPELAAEVIGVDPATGSWTQRQAIPRAALLPDEDGDPATVTIGAMALFHGDDDGYLDWLIAGRPVDTNRASVRARSSVWRLGADGAYTLDEPNTEALATIRAARDAMFADLDGNGSPELLVADEWGPIRLFQTASDTGVLTDDTATLGLTRFVGPWRSLAAGDLDRDGRLELIVGNEGTNTDRPWPSDAAPTDANASRVYETSIFRIAINGIRRNGVGWWADIAPVSSVRLRDIWRDGNLDLLLAHDNTRADGRGFLYFSDQPGENFVRLSADESGLSFGGSHSRLAMADADRDGRWDAVVTRTDGPPQLLRNGLGVLLDAQQNSVAFLGLDAARLVVDGPPRNPTGIGARVQLDYIRAFARDMRASKGSQFPFEVRAGQGGAQDSAVAVLEPLLVAERVIVHWPFAEGGTPYDLQAPWRQLNGVTLAVNVGGQIELRDGTDPQESAGEGE